MKPVALAIAAASYLASAALAAYVIRAISIGSPELSFVVGAVVGSQVGAVMHHRQPGAKATTAAKAILGSVLAVCAIAVGVILHLTMHPFKFAEISVPFAAAGSFFFPFFLFNTMWNALSKDDSASKPTDS